MGRSREFLILDRQFIDLLERIGDRTIIDPSRLYVLYKFACNAATAAGDIAEAGVYRGGSALLLSCASGNKRLHLFDTFSGLPFHDPERDRHRTGDFSGTSVESVRELLIGRDVRFYEGKFSEAFPVSAPPQFCLAHVDADLYESVRQCCGFFYPHMTNGGVIVFDDYGFDSCPGARAAVDEFFGDKPEVPIPLSSRQAIVMVRK